MTSYFGDINKPGDTASKSGFSKFSENFASSELQGKAVGQMFNVSGKAASTALSLMSVTSFAKSGTLSLRNSGLANRAFKDKVAPLIDVKTLLRISDHKY